CPAAIVCGEYHRTNNRVEAGSIAAASRDRYAHKWTNRSTLLFKDAPLARIATAICPRRTALGGTGPGPFARPAPLDCQPTAVPRHRPATGRIKTGRRPPRRDPAGFADRGVLRHAAVDPDGHPR